MPSDRPFSPAALHRTVPLAIALLLSACATTPPDAARSPAQPALACSLPSNCVSSVDGAPPLGFEGSAEQAMEQLRTTLAGFPEARLVRAEGPVLEAVFTTPAGFKDEVMFHVDAALRRVDYRSRSTFGLYDFGKNRSRMQLFAERFAAAPGR
jgi:uncharacterized protein (DUF1499 family)